MSPRWSLFQLNSAGLGSGLSQAEREDPEANVRAAAAAVYGGQGWKPWGGDGNTYKGKPFGSLGNHPYPGDSSGLLSSSGGTYSDGTGLLGRNPLPGGTSGQGASTTNYGQFVQTLQDQIDAILAESLDRADFDYFPSAQDEARSSKRLCSPGRTWNSTTRVSPEGGLARSPGMPSASRIMRRSLGEAAR